MPSRTSGGFQLVRRATDVGLGAQGVGVDASRRPLLPFELGDDLGREYLQGPHLLVVPLQEGCLLS